jgi:catechol 2,3-dioxygenase-like lactoylglutathione lyase family enzyme
VLHHLTLWVPNLERATEPWGWLLGRLGYQPDPNYAGAVLLFRHGDFALVLEESADMVPGMLHSRLRPGLNHLAFTLPPDRALDDLVRDSADHGWAIVRADGHPIAGGADVAYLEDGDGFEVELVQPAG